MKSALVLSLVLVAACSEGIDPSTGDVNVFLTDAPIDFTGVSAVNVTLSELTLIGGDELPDGDALDMDMNLGEGATINLLDYQDGEVVLLGAGTVPQGDYRRIRMSIDHAELVRDDDGDEATPEITELIEVPSDKVDVPVVFYVSGGEEVDVTLDFDAELSVQVNTTSGQHPYLLRPVINAGVTPR
jgi:hypothetical protein